MFTSLLKISIRNLMNHKVHTLLNIAGLSIGFAAFILIILFVQYEYHWDKHNLNYDRIYRVQRVYVKAVAAMDGNNISPHTHGITARLLEQAAPEIEKTVIIEESGRYLSAKPGQQIFERDGIFSETSLFEVFTYHFLEGDPSSALEEPNTMVLSETLANKLFPSGNAYGSTVMIEKKVSVKITGIYEDLPMNSQVRPNYIGSLSTIEAMRDVRNSWTGNHMTYVLLKEGADVNKLQEKIRNLYSINKSREEEKLSLCPLSLLYLSFNGEDDYMIIIFLYGMIGFFILLLSSFNYINMATAQAATRTREIAVRKVHGSSRMTLVKQILAEAIIVALLAVSLSFLVVENFLPVFNRITNKDIQFNYLQQWDFMLIVVGVAVLVGVLSGLYPALFLASRNVTLLLKGNLFRSRQKKVGPKRALVIIQFSISVLLIIITLSFSAQIRYLMNKSMGFDMEHKVFSRFLVSGKEPYDDFRDRILQHPEFRNACFSQHIPFVSFGGGNINWEGCQPGESVNVRFNAVSYDFLDCFKIPVILGRGFSREFPGDTLGACVINETALRSFGWADPIGKRVANNGLMVIGVVKDYHYKDMHNGIEPAILVLNSEPRGGEWTFSFDVDPQSMQKARAIVQEELERSFPNDAFVVDMLADAFKRENTIQIYHSVGRTIIFFTVLNILLAVMGLLGLVTFTTQRRTKEIGIRKINGSTPMSIFLLLTNEYMLLILISSIIAWPVAWKMYDLLPGANKQPMPASGFFFATGLVIAIALLTSGYQSWKASRANPVDALRYE
ncbi:MAG: ABC transporter permease [Bacteroidales bacterium]